MPPVTAVASRPSTFQQAGTGAAWLLVLGLVALFGVLVAALPLEIAAAVALGAIVVTLAFVEPVVALGALIAAVPISTEVTIETGDFSVTLIEPLLVLLVLSWLARGLARRDLRLEGGPLLVPLGLLLLAILASTLAAQRLGLAYKETIKWLELAVVFVFTVTHLRDERHQRAILAVLFLAGAGEALYGIYQYAAGIGPAAFTIGEALRAYGHFDQPNPFAGYLGTILPLAVAMAVWDRPRPYGLLAAFAALCCGAGILLSLSRGAWMGVVFALATMLATWSSTSRRYLAPALAASALIALLTATNLLPGAWADRLVAIAENFGIFDVQTIEVTGENFAVVERMAHWQAGWYMLLDHPILGVGIGNYPAAYDDYSLPGWREALGHAHNYYLNMAAESGLLGAAAFLFLLGTTYREIFRGLGRYREVGYRRALLVGLLGSLVVLTVHNLFDNLLVHGMQVQVGLLLGLVVLAAGAPVQAEASPNGAGNEGVRSLRS